MKIRKQYTVTILTIRGIAVLTSSNNSWVNWIASRATLGAKIYDCTFREAVDNLKTLKNQRYYIHKRRHGVFIIDNKQLFKSIGMMLIVSLIGLLIINLIS